MVSSDSNQERQTEWAPNREWVDEDWKKFIINMHDNGIFTWKEIAETVLGALNPPQVGTAIASNKRFQKHYPKRKMWAAVRDWLYSQSGHCVECDTLLNLQADHIVPIEEIGEEADRLENLQLLCRRCNVIKRASHKKGGLTYLTTSAALMWLLFKYRPKTYEEYHDICRKYGLTMANIRFQEAWAMAEWLKREGKYP